MPVKGARIFYVQKRMGNRSELTIHAAGCGGKYRVMHKTRKGLATMLYIQCNNCNCGMEFTLESSSRISNSEHLGNRWTVNVGAVWGKMAIGGEQLT